MSTYALDFETYSPVDLRKHGLRNYLDHPDFTPLIAALHGEYHTESFDFVLDSSAKERLAATMDACTRLYAHNAEFEYQVLLKMGINVPPHRIIDTAAVVRFNGGSSSLAAAARQFLGSQKLDEGSRLIKKFCIPGEYQELSGTTEFNEAVVLANPQDWRDFMHYCARDAALANKIRLELYWPREEVALDHPTYVMNRVGWPVDLALVKEMQRQYLENLQSLEREFRLAVGDDPAKPLNLNSHAQLKKWCLDRGVKASSFDRDAVAAMIPRVQKKFMGLSMTDPKRNLLVQVHHLLTTKQALGGSSLKKLQTILNTTSADGRLHNQYIHLGAVQSGRTTGVGVQMQNLKRIGAEAEDMDNLADGYNWSNDRLARSLRQCFTSSDPNGQLVVGDFSSVESRGLAWIADEQWKLAAYRSGQDLYKVQAAQIYGVLYDDVTKEQRQTGKLGELSCGYGAGQVAITKFAKNMGISMSENEAADLKTRWRDANPRIVLLWEDLETALKKALGSDAVGRLPIGPDSSHALVFAACPTPGEILAHNRHARSVEMRIHGQGILLRRVFHGVHMRGNSICYYKPSSTKSGAPWVNHYRDPDSNQVVFYSLYGGKLAGILTQSLCREIFMSSLSDLSHQLPKNFTVIGQFHDEIVVDWVPDPNGVSLREAKDLMAVCMTFSALPGFPLDADIKSDYRYTK